MVIQNGKIFINIITMLFLIAGPVLAAHGELKVVEAEGEVFLGDDSTIGQAKAAALNNARRAALEKATGVEVRGSSVVYNFQLINDLVLTATKGVIVKEKIFENACKSKDEHLYCTAKIEASVMPLHLERRGDFAVTKAVVHRVGSDAAKLSPVFQSKDEIQVRAAANQDSFLNIFSVDQYGNLAKLYPNEYCTYEMLPAGKELVLPDSLQRQAGLKFKVATPKGIKRAVESVLVVALKNKKQLLTGGSENPTIMDLMQELSNIDPSLWVEKTVGYEVRE